MPADQQDTAKGALALLSAIVASAVQNANEEDTDSAAFEVSWFYRFMVLTLIICQVCIDAISVMFTPKSKNSKNVSEVIRCGSCIGTD